MLGNQNNGTVLTLLILENGLGAAKELRATQFLLRVLTLLILENGLGGNVQFSVKA